LTPFSMYYAAADLNKRRPVERRGAAVCRAACRSGRDACLGKDVYRSSASVCEKLAGYFTSLKEDEEVEDDDDDDDDDGGGGVEDDEM